MNQRHLSLQQHIAATHSLQKDNCRKLRQVGSTDNLQILKKTPFIYEDAEVIGNYVYRKKDQIGAGYTSYVFKGKGIKDNSQYAIKVIDTKKYSASSLEMLENEIQILKNMNHPNILKLVEAIKEGDFCYLITQYCSQGDLLEYITRNGKLCQKQATSIIGQIIDATKYLFKMKVIHRDIKPANIFKAGKNWKIGDFGFAINAQTEIKTRQNVGTPLYMPLQSLLRNCYSPLSDIFSVGVIFYEMIVGITPWESKTEKELIRKMSTIPFSIPQKYKITSPIKFLLQKMCCPSRDNRMSKEEFMELKIDNFISLITFNEKLKSEEIQRRGRIFSRGKFDIQRSSKSKGFENQYQTNRKTSKNQIKGVPKIQRRISSKQRIVDAKIYGKRSSKISKSKQSEKKQEKKQEKKFQEKLQQKNCEVLINQLNYCRFLYYLIENASYMQLSPNSRGKVALAAFKHLLKLIKHLSDNKNNSFGFANWDVFRKSSRYQTILKTLKQYCQKYEKEYLIFLKKAEITVIKEVNQKLPEFSTNQHFTIIFYRKMLDFLAPFLRQCNHNLITIAQDIRQCRGQEGVARLQAMRSLLKYYQLLELSIKQFQNFSYFSSNSKIVVLKNYRQSKMGVADLMQIRQEIKSI